MKSGGDQKCLQQSHAQKAGALISLLKPGTQGEDSLENDSVNMGSRIRLQLVLMKKTCGSERTLDTLDQKEERKAMSPVSK